MLHSFALCDGDLDNKQVGTFTYDSTSKQFAMTIADHIAPADLPLSLEGFANKKKYVLSHKDSLRWIRGRICPPGRHNIRDILRDNGLNEYDEFELLMVTKAKCDRDALYLESNQ
jgi:hypothetical protein